ncbi:THAP domain-containing protein 2-like [Anabrus simplex]|uniref:THAP domain-containing protein 2-like n=1 Tax=Anabrus simplex TaxID=316456 RepID=UPI0035A34716
MPQKCSVPNCKGNYRTGPKENVFSFSTDDSKRAKRLRAIRRDDFVPSKNAKVCELHFKTHEVEWTTSMYDERNGKLLTAPLSHPRLVKGAVPSQFPNCPEYLSDTTSAHREAPDHRRCRVDNESLTKTLVQSLETYKAHVSTVSFKNFRN